MFTRRLPTLLPTLLTLALLGGSVASAHDDRDRDDRDQKVERFATLPKPGPGRPEGIAADKDGNIYVSTFDFRVPSNNIYVFRRDGRLKTTIRLEPGVAPLGLEFSRAGDLYVADFVNGNVLKFEPPFTSKSTPAATLPVCGGVPSGCGLNAITFDAAGNLYVSDSFGGKVFQLVLPGGGVTTFVEDELLKPGSHGFPPFGANGLAFKGTLLFIANTADDRVLKFDPDLDKVTVFAESINGADGIAFDHRGRLWVCANQGDELVALNARGRIVERRGSFEGIGRDGAPKGLLFPASLVISRGAIYVTNLALPLTNEPGAEGDEPEEDVTTYTVSRIELD